MSNNNSGMTRREVMKTTGTAAAVAATAQLVLPNAYAAEDNTIQIALVGCGGRGTGAAQNALQVEYGPIKLVAMADVFESKLSQSYNALSRKFEEKVDVPEERKFISFDGYKQAMDCLKPGDVVILTTPAAFRRPMFEYAIEKGLNVFMEKPVTVDAPSNNQILELNKKAIEKNLKVGVGLMCRHCQARGELHDRIQSGEIGDITLLRAYRQSGPTATAFAPPYEGKITEEMSELMYQIRNFHGFLWLSGGAVSDFLIHNIDESCWMKDDWPVEAKAAGGRHYRGDFVDQNFDSYSIEYTFKDGAKMFVEGRCMLGAHREFASYAHGTKGSAIISTSSHYPAKSRIYKGQHIGDKEKMEWEFPQPEENPYQLEWEHLIEAIRNDREYNEVERGVMASAVTSMGRMAAHTGQVITLDQFMAHDHAFSPNIEELTLESEPPLQMTENGHYPIPMPGIKKKREY